MLSPKGQLMNKIANDPTKKANEKKKVVQFKCECEYMLNDW